MLVHLCHVHMSCKESAIMVSLHQVSVTSCTNVAFWNAKFLLYKSNVFWQADAKTHRFKETVLRRGGVWRDVYGIAEKRVADLVREDKVDILVELTGHTANNRLGVMACRPAPVQVPPKTHLNGFQVKLSS